MITARASPLLLRTPRTPMADDAARDETGRTPDLLDDFWMFLARTGAVEGTVIQEYRRRFRDRWVPITTILVEERILEMSQVAVLLRKQHSEPGMRLGDLAVREGFCSREDIGRALQIQDERCPHPIDLILGDERVASVAAVDALKSYVQHLEGRVRSLERQLAGESVIRIHHRA